jgi:predicted outer membrane lipoprotein
MTRAQAVARSWLERAAQAVERDDEPALREVFLAAEAFGLSAKALARDTVREKDGRTLLMLAAIGGAARCAQFLLPLSCAEARDANGRQAVDFAVGADPIDLGLLDLLASGTSMRPLPGVFGDGALHFAADYGSAEAVALLLKRGADPQMRDSRGRTALMLAALEKSPAPFDLLFACVDPTIKDVDGRMAIHHAISSKNWRALDRLALACAQAQPEALWLELAEDTARLDGRELPGVRAALEARALRAQIAPRPALGAEQRNESPAEADARLTRRL